MTHFSRRQCLLRVASVASLSVSAQATLTTLGLSAAQAADVDQPFNRFPRMMQDWLVAQVRQASGRSIAAKARLTSKSEAEAYVLDVRARIAQAFGKFPERTPLNARTTRTIERDGYKIENVIFESRPNFPVTANLYLPTVDHPVPGVVGSCGHSDNGKAAEAYQSFAQGLVRQGYACLIFDPIGQGERLQYPKENGKSRYGAGVQEHLHGGNQQFLIGEFFGAWRAWDGMRALDYLLTRPEVDHAHVGITGNSGGGTMTTWLCGVEPRWTMAAPACFVTTFLRNAENELPADTEQCPPHVLALGLEHEDFIAAMAPKPVIILAKERDFFDVRGSEAAFKRLKKLYTLLGQPDNVQLHVGPTEHGYSIENREAMYRHFNKVTSASSATAEPKLVIEKDETLWCTQSGQVSELKPATLFQFTAAKAEQCRGTRGNKRGAALVEAIRQTLKLPRSDAGDLPPDAGAHGPTYPEAPPEFRILRAVGDRKYPLRYATTYAIETEENVFALCTMLTAQSHISRPPRRGETARLFIANRSSDAELRNEAWLRSLIEADKDTPTFTLDVRGIGESMPNTCGANTFDSAYGCDYFYAIHGIMLDRPYLGQRVYDVLRTLDWLKEYGYTQVELIGKRWGATLATIAGVLSHSVRKVHLVEPLESFHQLATTEEYEMPLSNLLPDVLHHFDLPDCYQELGNRLWSDSFSNSK